MLLLVGALGYVHGEISQFRLSDIRSSLAAVPHRRVALALGLTVLSYLTLTGYDALGLRYVGRRLPYRRIALASFVGYVFSFNVLSVFGGTAARFRLYSAWGLSAIEIGRIAAYCASGFWLGVFTVGGLALTLDPFPVPEAIPLPFGTVRPLGILLLGVATLYVAATAIRTRPIRMAHTEWKLPSPNITAVQIALGVTDWTLAGSALYTLLPDSAVAFLPFMGVFVLAQVTSTISQVPGGLGVLEGVLLFSLSQAVDSASLLAAILLFRVIYYFIPLVLASVLLGAHEASRRKKDLVLLAGRMDWVPRLVPGAFAFLTFVAGGILLWSGSTPAVPERLSFLSRFFPLEIIELSHFLGSVAGAGLLVLARGLQRRVDAAYYTTLALLALGIAASLAKGFDYEEALVLAAILTALVPCRREFFRSTGMLALARLSTGWSAAVLAVVASAAWLVSFSYSHVEYSGDLWWQFALEGDAPRAMRAAVGAALLVGLVFATRVFRPAAPANVSHSAENLAEVAALVAASPDCAANLALLGDKRFVFSQSRSAFVMYGIAGRSWVAMSDPIGPETEARSAAWDFAELCRRHGGWPVFYEVRPKMLSLYVDLGLTLLKVGEEGRVLLETFSLEGSAAKEQRSVVRRHERDGSTFRVMSASEVEPLLGRLREISDEWLSDKKTREKSFSMGLFDEAYLRNFRIATVWRDGRLVAFANIWESAPGGEVSPDLMRYASDAPREAMQYLFVKLMLWGKSQGYRWFNMGMAPLSGLESGEGAPAWNKLGSLVYTHGEHFYNFEGLRQYKEKFNPSWEPRYLASPGGLSLPVVLANLASLISGGVSGVFRR